MEEKNYKRALKDLNTFSPRSSLCPICRKDFRDGCNHSVTEAKDRLKRNLIDARLKDLNIIK